MKRFSTSLRTPVLLALLAVGLGLAGCKSDDRSMAEKWGDRQVTRGVKKELSKDPLYQYPDVVPVVNDGVVQLTGFVDTPEQRQRAAELATHAKGAREIINSIALKPRPTGPAGGRQVSTNAPAPTEPPEPAPPAAPEAPPQNQPPTPNP